MTFLGARLDRIHGEEAQDTLNDNTVQLLHNDCLDNLRKQQWDTHWRARIYSNSSIECVIYTPRYRRGLDSSALLLTWTEIPSPARAFICKTLIISTPPYFQTPWNAAVGILCPFTAFIVSHCFHIYWMQFKTRNIYPARCAYFCYCDNQLQISLTAFHLQSKKKKKKLLFQRTFYTDYLRWLEWSIWKLAHFSWKFFCLFRTLSSILCRFSSTVCLNSQFAGFLLLMGVFLIATGKNWKKWQ